VQVFFTEGLAIPSAGMAPISPGKLSVPALPVAPAATATHIEKPLEKPRPRAAVRRPVLPATAIRPVPAPTPIATEGETRPAALIGQVRDEQGKPIGNATVAVGERKTTTDASGSFVLGGLSAGRWAVKITHQAFTPLESRVWLVDGLKTPVTLSLVRPIVRQPATRVGLLGVGSLPTTDTLAQNLAEALVRNGAFPEIKPLAFIPRDEVLPVLRKFERPLYEVLDHDRPEPELREMVRDFFDFMGLSALAVARVDMLTRQEGNANRLSSRSKVELWQFNKEGHLEIKTLIEAGRSEDQDAALSKAEADQLYQFQIAKQAEEMTRKWEQNNPFSEFTDVPIEPGNGQRTDTRVELLPTGKPPVPGPAKPPD
jgi:hypothetical protein